MPTQQLTILSELLGRPIACEADVVYFLVEVRKLIETMGNRYPILRFFCDWVVHSKLDRKTAKEVLSKFDAYVFEYIQKGNTCTPDMLRRLNPLISFRRFSTDMFYLLGEHGLTTDVITDRRRFNPFLSLYVDVVSRTPLVVTDSRVGLKCLDNISVVKLTQPHARRPGSDHLLFAFGTRWALKKDDLELASVCDEMWFPKIAARQCVIPPVEFVSDNGRITVKAREAQSLWDALPSARSGA